MMKVLLDSEGFPHWIQLASPKLECHALKTTLSEHVALEIIQKKAQRS